MSIFLILLSGIQINVTFILIFGKRELNPGTEQIYINILHHLKKNSNEVEIDSKTELLGDKNKQVKKVKDHSGN